MTVENIQRIYLSAALEIELIEQLKSDHDWTLVSESTTCFVFEKCKRSHIGIIVRTGGEQE